MAKSTKKTPSKKSKKMAVGKKSATKQPKANFMEQLLKQREELRKKIEDEHNHNVIQLHANGRSGFNKSHGFTRFAGPRRKAA